MNFRKRKFLLSTCLLISTLLINSCSNDDILENENQAKKSIELKFISKNESSKSQNIVSLYTLSKYNIELESEFLEKVDNVKNVETNEVGSFFYFKENPNSNIQNRGSITNGYFFNFNSGCFVWGTMYIDDNNNTLFVSCGYSCGMQDRCLDGGGGQWAKTKN